LPDTLVVIVRSGFSYHSAAIILKSHSHYNTTL
jgi:hypothetical protein